MRKPRRSIVYVRPGKDVTLYVPVETPPDVIDYLNALKQDGVFSQGVMEIVTDFVRQQNRAGREVQTTLGDASESVIWSDTPIQVTMESVSGLQSRRDRVDFNDVADAPLDGGVGAVNGTKLDVQQIFLRAQQNSGKIIDSDDER